MIEKKSIPISTNAPEFIKYVTEYTHLTYTKIPTNENAIQKSKNLFLNQLENFKKLSAQESFHLRIHIEALKYGPQFEQIISLHHQLIELKTELEKSEFVHFDSSALDDKALNIWLRSNIPLSFSLISDLKKLPINGDILSLTALNYEDILPLYKNNKNELLKVMLFTKASKQLIIESQKFNHFRIEIFKIYSEIFNEKVVVKSFVNHYLFARLACFTTESALMLTYYSEKGVLYSLYDEYFESVKAMTTKYFQTDKIQTISHSILEMKTVLYNHYCKNSRKPPYLSLIPEDLKMEFDEKYHKAIESANQLLASESSSKKLQKRQITPIAHHSSPKRIEKEKEKEKEPAVHHLTDQLAVISLAVKKTTQIEKVQQLLSKNEHHQHWTKELPRIRRYEKLIELDAHQLREKALAFTDNGILRYSPTVTDSELSHDFNCHSFPFVEFLINHPKTFQQIAGGYFAHAQLITPQGTTLTGIIEIGIDAKEKVLVHRYFKPFNTNTDSLKQLFPTSIDIRKNHGDQTIFEAPEEPHQTTWSNLHFSMIDDQILSIQDKNTNITLQVFI